MKGLFMEGFFCILANYLMHSSFVDQWSKRVYS